MNPLLTKENNHLQVRIFDDASAEILDKSTGVLWRMLDFAAQEEAPMNLDHCWFRSQRSSCEEYFGSFRGILEGDALRFTVLGRLRREMGSFRVSVDLNEDALDFTISSVDPRLPSLVFPPSIESESLLLPRGIGEWVKEPSPDICFMLATSHLRMRWFGGLRGDAGWLAILADGYQDAGVHVHQLRASPGWLKSMGSWNPSRRVRYRFTGGGYVGVARAYRQWAMANGLHRLLTEKISENPAVNRLVGGRLLSIHQARPERSFAQRFRGGSCLAGSGGVAVKVGVSHQQVLQIVREAKSLGVANGLVNIRGWIRGGYDESHPDVWPPEPRLGSVEDLRRALNGDPDILGVLHDNYQDIYEQCPSFPEGVVKTSAGELLPGGTWAGGQAYILCAIGMLRYAKRNWPHISTLNPAGMFIDTTTAERLKECFDPAHTLTRAEDEKTRRELLLFYKRQGQLVGSEEGTEFGVSCCDWFENRHFHVSGKTLPLFPLVYHDAVVCYRYHSGSDPLSDLLWGYGRLDSVHSMEQWERIKESVKAGCVIDALHARVAAADLVNHRFLTEDLSVEKTEFSCGIAVVANYGREPVQVEGRTVPANGHIVLD